MSSTVRSATTPEVKKQKVGSRVKTTLICEITGKPFEVTVEVVQVNDTPVLFNFKARNWYKTQTAEEKQAIADQIIAGNL